MDARLESPTAPSRKFVAWLADPQAKIAVTGASGWIGRAVVHLALRAGLDPEAGRLRLFGSHFQAMAIAGHRLQVEALAGAAGLGEGDWLFLHLAVVGPDRIAGGDPLAVRAINDALLAEAMRLAGSGEVRRFVFASSGAVYQAMAAADPAPYGAMKLAHEAALRDWAARGRRPLLTARVFNLGGPYINHVARYAIGDLIQTFRLEGRIRVTADRGVFRSYVHVLEFARVLFEEALDDRRDEIAFDTCGREIVEVGDLAQTIGEVLGAGVEVERPGLRPGDPDWYVGSGQAYQAALFRSGATLCDLRTIIADTAGYLAHPDVQAGLNDPPVFASS